MALLHARYDAVRRVVDQSLPDLQRLAAKQGLVIDRMELWQEILEAGLHADRDWPGEPCTPEWEENIRLAAKKRLADLVGPKKPTPT